MFTVKKLLMAITGAVFYAVIATLVFYAMTISLKEPTNH